jgi:NAD+ synthase
METRIKDLFRRALWSSEAKGVVIGISGGIDSAVTAVLAAKAIGPERVLGVSMPSDTNDPQDQADAAELCEKFGIALITVPVGGIIREAMHTPGISGSPMLRGNFTARVRMAVLYNIAAARQYLVCGTSNKTEYLIGYSTKWGDNAADIQPLLHLWKKDVFAVAENLGIPSSITGKKPSAGFWEGQSDEGELGISYAELDAALTALEEQHFEPRNALEEKVLGLVKESRHKRIPAMNLLF